VSTAADVVRRLSDEVFMAGNLGAFEELVSSSFVSHDPPPGVAPTRDGLRDLARMVTTAFATRAFEYDEIVPLTDGRVVENWAMTASHVGELFGLPPSGQSVRVRGMEIWRCENGRIVEHWGAVDMGDVVQKASAR
jgi:predicted ester cyclase